MNSSKLNRPIQLLKRKKILIGPAFEISNSNLVSDLKSNAAEVVSVNSIAAVNRIIEDQEFDIILWNGKTSKDLGDLNYRKLDQLGLKLIFLLFGSEKDLLKANFDKSIFPVINYNSTNEIVDKIWILSKRRLDAKLIPNDTSDIKLDFKKLISITEGDVNFMANLFKSYFNSLNECSNLFSIHIYNNDLEGIKFLLHKIRATINTFQIKALELKFSESIKKINENQLTTENDKIKIISDMEFICKEVENQLRIFASENDIKLK